MDLIKAADDARRLLRGFRAFDEVAAALDAAGKLDQHAAEMTKQLADLRAAVAEETQLLAMCRDEAAKIKADAKVQAEQTTGAASAKAMALVADAQTAAANTELAAEQIKAQASALLAQAQSEVMAALTKREQLEADCDVLEKRLAKAQAQIAKLLG